MKKLYYFFNMDYETIIHPPDLPFRILLESIGYVGLHWHPDIEILLMLKGEVSITNSQKQHTLGIGQIMFINSNEMHSLVEKSENLLLVLQVDPEVFQFGSGDTVPGYFYLDEDSRISGNIISRLRTLLAKLSLEKWKGEKGFELYCKAALYEIVGMISRHIPSAPMKEHRNTLHLRQVRIKQVMDFLHKNYKRKISLGEIAEAMEISPYYLSHLIKEGTGWSFQENLNLIRTGKAIDMMLRTDKNFLDISLSTGFSDPKYFNQYFKRLFGMTPKQIKRSPDWKEAILNYFNNEGLEPQAGKDLLTQYLEKNQ